MNDRRKLLTGCLGLLFARLPAQAQLPQKLFRIAILARSTDGAAARHWDDFTRGLHELGYVEGRNLVIERKDYGEGAERLSALAAELARLPIDVIVTGSSPAPEAAKRATSTIPIVMTTHPDPVVGGLVASLARPGGNVTGLSSAGPELRGKQLQLLVEAVPGLRRVAVLANPDVPTNARELSDVEVVARSLNVQIQAVRARAPGELSAAFAVASKERAGAMLVLPSAMFADQRARLIELAAKEHLPAMYQFRDFAEAGGLMAYGPSIPYIFRRAAWYVDRILKGAKAGDLPVELPTKYELVFNLKTAKALGHAIPRGMLGRADALIE